MDTGRGCGLVGVMTASCRNTEIVTQICEHGAYLVDSRQKGGLGGAVLSRRWAGVRVWWVLWLPSAGNHYCFQHVSEWLQRCWQQNCAGREQDG